jgi:hypothetical protein
VFTGDFLGHIELIWGVVISCALNNFPALASPVNPSSTGHPYNTTETRLNNVAQGRAANLGNDSRETIAPQRGATSLAGRAIVKPRWGLC